MPDIASIVISIAVVLLLVVGGIIFFKRMENTFADVV
jgi:ABC-type polysaccharide/polyol phosphate export permease